MNDIAGNRFASASTIGLHNASPPSISKLTLDHDTQNRARNIKVELESNSFFLKRVKPRAIRRKVEDDPENRLIVKLRTVDKMGWGDIANWLNNERVKRGEPATMTQPAVYSRFVRNGPKIAATMGDLGFDSKDHMHLRNPRKYPTAEGDNGIFDSSSPTPSHDSYETQTPPTTAKSKKRRISRELERAPKKSKLAQDCQELEATDMTLHLWEAVAEVDANKWNFVSDVLERMTGKLIDPLACESMFKKTWKN
ncbi:uncharacterized protein BDR25DRAFT_366204 [Lindgomyces ingoldianus]|uniref:Uncharacterized protein n=1 Tax=Lindgomyces ingoldianus TaxID=673940 RepID=A0ACB6R151_9PLEO|nr:uncharacterized protein BDR25DRAFT_366204 [Lindgomyces ingoldianus]KAF2472978.1 hypothetical protein BDR25DRAFT_366204 [Lindgomyces ingoldianus]